MIRSVTISYVFIGSAPFVRPLPGKGRALWVLVWFLVKPAFPLRAFTQIGGLRVERSRGAAQRRNQ
jgi:hypothetical protein